MVLKEICKKKKNGSELDGLFGLVGKEGHENKVRVVLGSTF